MRSQNLKSYGCQAFAGLFLGVIVGGIALLLSGWGTTEQALKVVTPYGVYDTTTTGTTVIDTTPLFGEQLPPPIDYSKYPAPTLEK